MSDAIFDPELGRTSLHDIGDGSADRPQIVGVNAPMEQRTLIDDDGGIDAEQIVVLG
jgi:hypothetical protein